MGTNLKHLGISELSPGRGWNCLTLAYLVQKYPGGECYRATRECTDRCHEQVAVGLSFNCNSAKYGAENKCEPVASILLCYPTHARRLQP